jgi:adenylate cyclase
VTANVTVRRLVLDDEDSDLAELRFRRTRRRGGRRSPMLTSGAAPQGSRLGPIGEELPVAVLFADIRGFTAFSQALLPYDVIHELQRHLRQVTRAVERHGGVTWAMA